MKTVVLTNEKKFALTGTLSRVTVMLVTASFITACKYLHRGLSMYARDAVHIISKKKIENEFIDCKLIGERSLRNLVAKFVHSKPFGSIEHLRKELNLKKIIPIVT